MNEPLYVIRCDTCRRVWVGRELSRAGTRARLPEGDFGLCGRKPQGNGTCHGRLMRPADDPLTPTVDAALKIGGWDAVRALLLQTPEGLAYGWC